MRAKQEGFHEANGAFCPQRPPNTVPPDGAFDELDGIIPVEALNVVIGNISSEQVLKVTLCPPLGNRHVGIVS